MSADVAKNVRSILARMEEMRDLQRVETDTMLAIAGYLNDLTALPRAQHTMHDMQRAHHSPAQQQLQPEDSFAFGDTPDSALNSPTLAADVPKQGAKRKAATNGTSGRPAKQAKTAADVAGRQAGERLPSFMLRMYQKVQGGMRPAAAVAAVAGETPRCRDVVEGVVQCVESTPSAAALTGAQRQFIHSAASLCGETSRVAAGVAHQMHLQTLGDTAHSDVLGTAVGVLSGAGCAEVAVTAVHDVVVLIASYTRDVVRGADAAPLAVQAGRAARATLAVLTAAPDLLGIASLWVLAAGDILSEFCATFAAAQLPTADVEALRLYFPAGVAAECDVYAIAKARLLEAGSAADVDELRAVSLRAAREGGEWCLQEVRGRALPEDCNLGDAAQRNAALVAATLLLHGALDSGSSAEARVGMVESARDLLTALPEDNTAAASCLRFLGVISAVHAAPSTDKKALAADVGSTVLRSVKHLLATSGADKLTSWVSSLNAIV